MRHACQKIPECAVVLSWENSLLVGIMSLSLLGNPNRSRGNLESRILRRGYADQAADDGRRALTLPNEWQA